MPSTTRDQFRVQSQESGVRTGWLVVGFQRPINHTGSVPCSILQWEAADAEIKVSSGENTELKRSPFKTWSRSVYGHNATLTAKDFFLGYFYPSGPFTCIFSETSPDFSCSGCA